MSNTRRQGARTDTACITAGAPTGSCRAAVEPLADRSRAAAHQRLVARGATFERQPPHAPKCERPLGGALDRRGFINPGQTFTIGATAAELERSPFAVA
jgi:hypothetical protein